jgi:hypothetical protein
LHIPCSSFRISSFSKKPCLLDNGVRNQDLGTWCAC